MRTERGGKGEEGEEGEEREERDWGQRGGKEEGLNLNMHAEMQLCTSWLSQQKHLPPPIAAHLIAKITTSLQKCNTSVRMSSLSSLMRKQSQTAALI